jgi:sec-independent protein translocase protein TatA
MAGLTPAHLLIILVIALIVIGPGKLPEVGAAIGKSFREFQKATGQVQDAPATPAAQQAPAVQPVQAAPVGAQPPAQSYYAAQPGYGAPVQGQPAYPTQPVYPVQAGQPIYPVQPGYPVAPQGQPVAYPPMAYPPVAYQQPVGLEGAPVAPANIPAEPRVD